MTSLLAKIASAAVMAAACAGVAFADGMIEPAGSLKDAPVVVAPVAVWTGCYGGASLGGAWGRFRNETSTTDVLGAGRYGTGATLPPGSDPGYYFWKPGDTDVVNGHGRQDVRGGGIIGGGQLGCNRQIDRLVIGIEGDLSGVGLSGSSSTTTYYGPQQPGQTFTIRSTSSADGLFTLRGRVGITNNNWLFYATGGLAVTNVRSTFSFTDTQVGAQESGEFHKLVTGYALGGGAEVMLGDGWSLKGEYLHLGFGKASVTSNNFGGMNGSFVYKPETFISHSTKLDADIFRIGINHKF